MAQDCTLFFSNLIKIFNNTMFEMSISQSGALQDKICFLCKQSFIF